MDVDKQELVELITDVGMALQGAVDGRLDPDRAKSCLATLLGAAWRWGLAADALNAAEDRADETHMVLIKALEMVDGIGAIN